MQKFDVRGGLMLLYGLSFFGTVIFLKPSRTYSPKPSQKGGYVTSD